MATGWLNGLKCKKEVYTECLTLPQRRNSPDPEFVFALQYRNDNHAFTRIFAKISEAIGRPFHLHLLRHVFATSLLDAGADIKTVSELLGHSAASITTLYLHSNPDKKKRAVRLIESGHIL